MDVGPGIRRACDILGGSLGILVLSPVLLLAAIAIKISSRGPVLFRQERVGIGGRLFYMPKFRSMIINADELKSALAARERDAMDGVRFKLKRDPRITRVGRIMRRFSLDELPQLWSLVSGDMTIVGPRPPVLSEVNLYDARAARRLEVTPGLTCHWQVRGRSDLSFAKQVAFDIQYIDESGALDDVRIVLATIPAVLSGRGAY